jgi:hypothetical protein
MNQRDHQRPDPDEDREQPSDQFIREPPSPHRRRQSRAATASFAAVALVGLAALIAGAAGFKFLADWTQVPLIVLAAGTTALTVLAQERRLSKRRTIGLLGTVLMLFTAILIGGIVTRPQPAKPTELTTTRVYDENGELLPKYRVTERTRADFCIDSLRSADIQAFRCFTTQGPRKGPRDPCWTNLLGTSAVCLLTPWSNSATVITKIKERPSNVGGAPHPNTLWALELANGDHCTFVDGTAEVIAGERVNYNCDRGSVLGDPDRTSRAWKVRSNRRHSSEIGSISVRHAWL